MILGLWYNIYGDSMDILLQLFHEKEIQKLLEMNPKLKYLKKENTRFMIKFLSDLKCNNRVIRSIIIRNSFFLLRPCSEVDELISILKEYGVENLDMAFYIYPNLLNKNAYEIDNFYIKKRQEGYSNDDINNILEVEPFLIDAK